MYAQLRSIPRTNYINLAELQTQKCFIIKCLR